MYRMLRLHLEAPLQPCLTDFFLVSSAFATDFVLVSPACAVAWSLRLISRHAALHSSATMLAHPGHSQKPLAAISAHESFEQPSATARQGDTKTGGGLRPSSEHAALHSSLTMLAHPGHWQKPLAAISAHESSEQPSATARQGDTKTGHASLHSSLTMPSHPGHWQRSPSAISKHESVE